MLRQFFPELVMSTDLLSFEHPSVLLFCFVVLSSTIYNIVDIDQSSSVRLAEVPHMTESDLFLFLLVCPVDASATYRSNFVVLTSIVYNIVDTDQSSSTPAEDQCKEICSNRDDCVGFIVGSSNDCYLFPIRFREVPLVTTPFPSGQSMYFERQCQ